MPVATAKPNVNAKSRVITKVMMNTTNSQKKYLNRLPATNWGHLRLWSYSQDWCEQVENVAVYKNSVHARYTITQRFYCQNWHDGDGYLILPQNF
jgi:hypothetical protein